MEKCAKCKAELGFNKLHINEHINEWLCLNCNDLYIRCLEIFNNDFIKLTPHPWSDFLKARYYAMLWMREEQKYTDKQIAEYLSMDERQVYLILSGKPWECDKDETN